MEECTEIAILLDFYGQLLTPRQFEILDLHYNADYSLGEIAGQLRISRQGVYDGVKKGKETLKHYEDKLGLAERFMKQMEVLRQVLMNLQEARAGIIKEDEKKRISYCIKELERIIKEL